MAHDRRRLRTTAYDCVWRLRMTAVGVCCWDYFCTRRADPYAPAFRALSSEVGRGISEKMRGKDATSSFATVASQGHIVKVLCFPVKFLCQHIWASIVHGCVLGADVPMRALSDFCCRCLLAALYVSRDIVPASKRAMNCCLLHTVAGKKLASRKKTIDANTGTFFEHLRALFPSTVILCLFASLVALLL